MLGGQTRQRVPSHLGKCECDPIVIAFPFDKQRSPIAIYGTTK